MELRHLNLGLLSLLLIGCAQTQPNKNLSVNSDNFYIELPTSVSHKYVRSDGSTAYTTFEAPTAKYRAEDFSIEIYESTGTECDQSVTGVSKMTELENGEVSWGAVDAWKFEGLEGWDSSVNEKVFCKSRKNSIMPAKGMYAACAAKSGEIAVICIYQITDSAADAEKIYKSFLWLK